MLAQRCSRRSAVAHDSSAVPAIARRSRRQLGGPGDATCTIGALSGTTGTATFGFTPKTTLSATPQGVVTATKADGDNSASWSPTVLVSLPSGAVAGMYAGTITNSVS